MDLPIMGTTAWGQRAAGSAPRWPLPAVAIVALLGAANAPAVSPADAEASGDRVLMVAESTADLFDLDETEDAAASSPSSAEDLFDLDDASTDDGTADAASADDLFGIEDDAPTTSAPEQTAHWWDRFEGFWQNELAYTYSEPEHFSKWRNHFRFSTDGAFDNGVSWKVSGHLIYDPIYDLDNFYPDEVEDDLDVTGYLYETYIDFEWSGWDFRLGNQLIVWGETVGLFFADVVSGLDLRDFVLPDFELIRLPQPAARAEYFGDSFYLEFVFIPLVQVNEISRFGADFHPLQPQLLPAGIDARVLDDSEPGKIGRDAGAGVRGSYLVGGWDASLFYYTSPDRTAAFERRITPGIRPRVTVRPKHERIHQVGTTVAKDVSRSVLFKSEAIFTMDRLVQTDALTDIDGLVETDELRYVLGLEWAGSEHSINAQLFQTWFVDHVKGVVPDEVESGITLFWETSAIHPDIEPEVLLIRVLNRDEWLLQAKVDWRFRPDWRATLGIDVFEGPGDGILGRYDARDRVYTELRYSF